MRIAVYSGSFDPLHIGHEAILRSLCGKYGFDATYLIVSPQNPFKDAHKADNAQERYDAARKLIGLHPELHARVDDIEMTMPAPHYTIRTLDALRVREPQNSFTLVVGGDNLAVFEKWRDYARILLEYGVIVFPREGSDSSLDRKRLLAENPSYRITVADEPLVPVSSSEIRAALAAGQNVSSLIMK